MMNRTARVGIGTGIFWALALALVCGLFVGSAVRAEPASRGDAPSFGADAGRGYVPGRILVKTEEGVSAAELKDVNRKNGGRVEKKLRKGRIVVVDLPENLSVEEAVARYEAAPAVEYAEPDFILTPSRTPDDPSYPNLWGLNNTGQTGGTTDADVDAPEAWDVATGDPGTVVAVIDTGVDINHPDLNDNVWVNTGETPGNNVDDDGNGYVDDVNGWDFFHDNASVYDAADGDKHGTHVAGTIAAEGNNGGGVAGVNWEAAIMPLKFLGPKGGSTSDGIAALDYAVANGAKISNNSWGGGGSQSLHDAIDRADAAGHLFVAAAGNNGRNTDNNPSYPASYPSPNIVSVAATDSKDALAGFSNYGADSVDLAAPGVGIYSTLPGNAYGNYSGTSMATPHVAGTAALILSEHPELDDAGLKARLLDSVDEKSNLAGKTVAGGRLNAALALGAQGPPPADGAPEVTGTTPGDGAAGVRRANDVTATFSEEMDENTINSTTVTLKNAGTGATAGAAVSCDDPCRTVRIDPSETLGKKIRYVVTIEGGDDGVKTPAGETMAAGETWSFTTGKK